MRACAEVAEQDGVQNPRGMMGIRLEVDVHIVTCSATSAQNIIKCCNLAGLEVSNIVLEPLASAQAVLSQDEKELGVVLVDIGGGTGDIAIYSAGSIVHTSVLALGGAWLFNRVAGRAGAPAFTRFNTEQFRQWKLSLIIKIENLCSFSSGKGRRKDFVFS